MPEKALGREGERKELEIDRRRFLTVAGLAGITLLQGAPLLLGGGEPEEEGPMPVGQFNQGINPGWVMDNQGNTLFNADRAKELVDLGAGRVRIEFRKPFAEWDSATLSGYEDIVNLAVANNLKILGLVDYETWNGGGSSEWNKNSWELEAGNAMNQYVEDFVAKGVVPIVERFGDRMEILQVWNEPNGKSEEMDSYLQPSIYARMLTEVANRVRKDLPILTGGILNYDSDYMHKLHYTGEVVAGWRQEIPYDQWGAHLYVDKEWLTSEVSLYKEVSKVRWALNMHTGGGAKKIWFSEKGWQSGKDELGRTWQAENLKTAYQFMEFYRDKLGIGPVFWYQIRDHQEINKAGVPVEKTWGLIDGSGWKPSGFEYRRWASF